MLLTPIKINKLQLKNRVAMAPMVTHLAEPGGTVGNKLIDYYVERAKGGVGLIYFESTFVHTSGMGGMLRMSIDSDDKVAGLKRLTDAVHQYDCAIFAEPHHAGPYAPQSVLCETPVAASSAFFFTNVDMPPRALKRDEIKEIVNCFALAAKRSKRAGFDGILIQASHGYLITSFLSPFTNKRTDEYGGSVENRTRFLVEIVEESRRMVGDDYPITVRISGNEYIDGGNTRDDCVKIAQILERAGVDALQISGGVGNATQYITLAPMTMPAGYMVEDCAYIKRAISSIPVSAVGRINTAQMAERILAEGKADMVVLGRELIADPYFMQKIIDGTPEQIRPCISCNQGCIGSVSVMKQITCFANPLVGMEGVRSVTRTDAPKNVAVLGGGPAGLAAAMVAAQRGHHVTLFEKENVLGGQLYLASLPPDKSDIAKLINYMERQFKKAGGKAVVGCAPDTAAIAATKPDVLLVAAGSLPAVPPIKGVGMANVITAQDVLVGKAQAAEGRAIIIGAGATGLETAEFLIAHGHEVMIVEMLDTVAKDMEATRRYLTLRYLGNLGVRMLTGTKVVEIKENAVVIERNNAREEFSAASVVLAAGVRKNDDIGIDLLQINCEIKFIGDCEKVANGLTALHSGYFTALDI